MERQHHPSALRNRQPILEAEKTLVWSRLNHQRTTGFSPWFHLPGFLFGNMFVSPRIVSDALLCSLFVRGGGGARFPVKSSAKNARPNDCKRNPVDSWSPSFWVHDLRFEAGWASHDQSQAQAKEFLKLYGPLLGGWFPLGFPLCLKLFARACTAVVVRCSPCSSLRPAFCGVACPSKTAARSEMMRT